MHIDKKIQSRLLTRNIRYSYIDGMTFCFMLGTTIPYLGFYILRFNGPAELVSLIASIQPIILSVVSLLVASYVNSFQKKKPVLMPPSLIVRLFVLIMAFIPFLPKSWHAWTLFWLWGLMYLPWAFCTLSWSPLISNIIPEEMRGRFFGTRNALTGATTLLGTFLTGIIIAKIDFYLAFTSIFLVSFVGTMISLYYLNKHIEPVVADPGEAKDKIRSNDTPLFQLDFKNNLRTFEDPTYGSIFRLSCLAIFIFHIGYQMSIPLFTLRQVQELNFNNAQVGLLASVSGLAALFGSYVGGHSSDRFGYRYVLLFSTLLSVIPPLIWAATAGIAWFIFAAALWGFTGNAYLICFLYMVLALSPYQERSRFVAMNTVVGNLAGALGPVIGMFLIRVPSIGIRGALAISAAIMLVGAVFAYDVSRKGTF